MKKHVWRPLFNCGLGVSHSWCLSSPPSRSFNFSWTSHFGDLGTLKSATMHHQREFFFLSINSFVQLWLEFTFRSHNGSSNRYVNFWSVWFCHMHGFLSLVFLSFHYYLSCTLFLKGCKEAGPLEYYLIWSVKDPETLAWETLGETTGQFGGRGVLYKWWHLFLPLLPFLSLSHLMFGVSQDLVELCSRKWLAVKQGRFHPQTGRARPSLYPSLPLVLTAKKELRVFPHRV